MMATLLFSMPENADWSSPPHIMPSIPSGSQVAMTPRVPTPTHQDLPGMERMVAMENNETFYSDLSLLGRFVYPEYGYGNMGDYAPSSDTLVTEAQPAEFHATQDEPYLPLLPPCSIEPAAEEDNHHQISGAVPAYSGPSRRHRGQSSGTRDGARGNGPYDKARRSMIHRHLQHQPLPPYPDKFQQEQTQMYDTLEPGVVWIEDLHQTLLEAPNITGRHATLNSLEAEAAQTSAIQFTSPPHSINDVSKQVQEDFNGNNGETVQNEAKEHNNWNLSPPASGSPESPGSVYRWHMSQHLMTPQTTSNERDDRRKQKDSRRSKGLRDLLNRFVVLFPKAKTQQEAAEMALDYIKYCRKHKKTPDSEETRE